MRSPCVPRGVHERSSVVGRLGASTVGPRGGRRHDRCRRDRSAGRRSGAPRGGAGRSRAVVADAPGVRGRRRRALGRRVVDRRAPAPDRDRPAGHRRPRWPLVRGMGPLGRGVVPLDRRGRLQLHPGRAVLRGVLPGLPGPGLARPRCLPERPRGRERRHARLGRDGRRALPSVGGDVPGPARRDDGRRPARALPLRLVPVRSRLRRRVLPGDRRRCLPGPGARPALVGGAARDDRHGQPAHRYGGRHRPGDAAPGAAQSRRAALAVPIRPAVAAIARRAGPRAVRRHRRLDDLPGRALR